MPYFNMYYPKYNVDITRYDNHIYLGATFSHNNKVYLINKSAHEKDFVQDMRLVRELENKDGMLYSELILAINKFNKDKLVYVVSKEISKKILKTYDIRYKGYFNIKMFSDIFFYGWDNSVMIKNTRFPVLYIEC